MDQSADSWQYILPVAAVLIIVFKIWQGWRLGLVRQLVSIAALIVASGVGILGARGAGALLRPVLPFPEQVLAPIGGLLLGFVVWAVITMAGAILFKRTSQQGITLVRVGYELAGAALGALHGVVLVWMLALGLRLLGSVAETTLALEKNPRLAGRQAVSANASAVRLAALKRSLDQGVAGRALRSIDPLPQTTYSTLGKLTRLVANSKSIERFLAYPGVRPVMNHPKVVALLSDPEVGKALSERRYFALLSNPRLVAAADDPDVSARLHAIDFEKALDFALQGRKQP